MAFLSHEIPWATLRMVLKYDRAKSVPGPQDADIYFRERPGIDKAMDYFAQKLQSTVIAHAIHERTRFRSAEVYRRRASGWTTSNTRFNKAHNFHDDPMPVSGNSDRMDLEQEQLHVASIKPNPNEVRIRRNQELRRMLQARNEAFPTETEERMIFSAEMAAKYNEYMKFPVNEHLQRIESWIPDRREKPTGQPNDHDLARRRENDSRLSAGDVFKLLMIEAAGMSPTNLGMTPAVLQEAPTTKPENRHDEYIETLLLLTHHPHIGLRRFLGGYQGCCNISCGPENLGEEVLGLFIYLNLVLTLRDGGDTVITELSGNDEEFSYEDCERLYPTPQKGRYGPQRSYSWLLQGAVQLKPRPAYMDTRSWKLLMSHAGRWHELFAESAVAQMAVFPRRQRQCDKATHNATAKKSAATAEDKSGEILPHETDPLANPDAAKELLKSLWRILIAVEMLMQEVVHQARQTRVEGAVGEEIEDEGRSQVVSGFDLPVRSLYWDRLVYEFFMSHFKKRRRQMRNHIDHSGQRVAKYGRGNETGDGTEAGDSSKGGEDWKDRIVGPWPEYDYKSSRERA